MHNTPPVTPARTMKSDTTNNVVESPVIVSGAPRAATPSVARPRATSPDTIPAQLRAAHRAQDWTAFSVIARANRGHPCLNESPHGNNTGGHTYLQLVSACGEADACRALLEAGVDKDVADARGSTALHLAATRGHVEVIKVLLQYGAKLRLNHANKTPLHDAAWAGHTECVVLLVPVASNAGLLDAVGNDGRVALHCASLCTDPKIVDALLNAGANPDVVDLRGRTPLDWARDLMKASGDATVAEHLQNAGAHASQDLDRVLLGNK